MALPSEGQYHTATAISRLQMMRPQIAHLEGLKFALELRDRTPQEDTTLGAVLGLLEGLVDEAEELAQTATPEPQGANVYLLQSEVPLQP